MVYRKFIFVSLLLYLFAYPLPDISQETRDTWESLDPLEFVATSPQKLKPCTDQTFVAKASLYQIRRTILIIDFGTYALDLGQ